jgi:hypothetical protein
MIIRNNRPNVKVPAEWNMEDGKNISAIILEYYGINTNNVAVKPFLERQEWYPVNTPRKIDTELKETLLKIQ